MSRYRVRVATPDWEPLERVAELAGSRATLPDLEPDQFMAMGRVVGRRGHVVHLYKHIDTRRYLNLDASGHAFRYVATESRSSNGDPWCRYEPCTDLRTALEWVLRLHDEVATVLERR